MFFPYAAQTVSIDPTTPGKACCPCWGCGGRRRSVASVRGLCSVSAVTLESLSLCFYISCSFMHPHERCAVFGHGVEVLLPNLQLGSGRGEVQPAEVSFITGRWGEEGEDSDVFTFRGDLGMGGDLWCHHERASLLLSVSFSRSGYYFSFPINPEQPLL